MSIMRKFTLALAGTSLVAVTACTNPGYVAGDQQKGDYQKTQQGAVIGGLIGATVGGLTARSGKGRAAVKGAVLGAGAGAIVGSVLDKQERDLRASLGNDAQITNTGDRLIVTLPQDILFGSDSATLRPDLVSDIRSVASSLMTYPQSTVQVLGHTDNTGDAGYNYDLSERRAQSVVDVLVGQGVPASRLRAIGRGEDQPIASNLNEEGKARNRRVEIVILPDAV